MQSWSGLTPGKDYRLQTMTSEVAEDTSTIRSLDWNRDRFDIEFRLERGTTYNSYIIRGSEKTALVDTSHEKFEELLTKALRKECRGLAVFAFCPRSFFSLVSYMVAI